VNGQWQLFCVIHNMEKLMKYGHLAVWESGENGLAAHNWTLC
jgi:hypothetical protein